MADIDDDDDDDILDSATEKDMVGVVKGKHMMMISNNYDGITLPPYDSEKYDELEDCFDMLTDTFVYASNVSIWMCSFYDCCSVGSKHVLDVAQYEMFKRDMPLTK